MSKAVPDFVLPIQDSKGHKIGNIVFTHETTMF